MLRKVFLYTVILLGITSGGGWAQDVELTWDPSDHPDVAGYHVYYKAETPEGTFDGTEAAQGPSPLNVGLAPNATITVPDGTLYYFAVTAYDTSGNESEFSNVIASQWVPTGNFPANSASVSPQRVDFRWDAAPAEAEVVSYKLIYTTDLTTLQSAIASLAYPKTRLFAGISFLALAGFGMNSRKRVRHLLPAIIACSLFLVSGCGGGGGSSDAPIGSGGSSDDAAMQIITDIPTNTHSAYGLKPSSTYYWQVIAVDATGEELKSPVYTFTTAVN